MTEAVYTATAEYIVEMEQRPVKHRVSVSGVLKRLGVSRSGYHAWKKRCPSAAEKHRGEVKEKILKIYEDSHQNYGAPKITRELWKGGEKIAVKTVANYMRQMGIKAQWIKPYTRTTIDSDFSRWSYVKKKYKLNMPFLRLAYPAKASAFSSNAA